MARKKLKSLDLLEPILIETFSLIRLFEPTSLMNEWLSATGVLNDMEKSLLYEVQGKLIKSADFWNEEELKMQFISFMTFLAHFDEPINTYYDREISEIIDENYLNCKADMMLSKGIGELIKTPYFFMHEYKREKKYSGDPIGQMLGAMLIGQAKNANQKPIYGCYVQGRYWYFCVLEGKTYTISKGFDASEKEDIEQIIFILRKLKTIILEKLMD